MTIDRSHMIRRPLAIVGLLVGLFCIASSGRAEPPVGKVKEAENSVFHVVASGCNRKGLAKPTTYYATGFAVRVGGEVKLVTALHAVAGCQRWQVQYKGDEFKTEVVQVYRKTDLALLKASDGLSVPALSLGAEVPSPGQVVYAIGYGKSPRVNPRPATVRKGGGSKIEDLVQGTALASLTEQGFPDVTATIINLVGALTPGDSGAPLIDDAGAVVGIVNGNLMQGTFPDSWGFPSATIRELLASKEKLPSSVISDVLIAEEDPRGTSTSSADNAPPHGITCGARTFQFRGTQTFSRIVATADPFSLSHIQLVQNYAQLNGLMIPPDTRFDVYVDPVSGADFVVPTDFELTVYGADCIATDKARQLQMRISTDAVSDFFLTTAPAMSFAARMVMPGEIAQPNPQFSTVPISRNDGMKVQRYAFFYGVAGQYPPYNEGYLTFAWRRDTLMEVSVRTLTPALAARGNVRGFPSIASVYAASFVPDF